MMRSVQVPLRAIAASIVSLSPNKVICRARVTRIQSHVVDDHAVLDEFIYGRYAIQSSELALFVVCFDSIVGRSPSC